MSGLNRKTELERKPMRRKTVRRDWSDAERKRGPCRICGHHATELAHTIGRSRQDEVRVGPRGGKALWVNPDSVIPLCKTRPEVIEFETHSETLTAGCHRLYDAGDLSILAFLTLQEQLNAVWHAGGIASAYARLTGRRKWSEERS